MSAVVPPSAMQALPQSIWGSLDRHTSSAHQGGQSVSSKRSAQRLNSSAQKSHQNSNGSLQFPNEDTRSRKGKMQNNQLKTDASTPSSRSSSRSEPSAAAQHTDSRETANTQQKMTPYQKIPVLAIKSVNGTFDADTLPVPYHPNVIRIGRMQNAHKTNPQDIYLYFDSKVLSRFHAEVWADRNGQVFVRDVKSSNGTFLNGERLSPEGKESAPFQLQDGDILELGIDILSEDKKDIVHHKIGVKIVHVGFPKSGVILPGSKGVDSPGQNKRSSSQSSASSRGSASTALGGNNDPANPYKPSLFSSPPVSIDDIGKLITADTLRARQDCLELARIRDAISATKLSRSGALSPQRPGSTGAEPGIAASHLGNCPLPEGMNGVVRSEERLAECQPESSNSRGSYLSVSPVEGASLSSQSSPEMEHKEVNKKRVDGENVPAGLSGSPLSHGQINGVSAGQPHFGTDYSPDFPGLPMEASDILKNFGISQPTIPDLVEALTRTKSQLDSQTQQVDALQRLVEQQNERLELLNIEFESGPKDAKENTEKIPAGEVSSDAESRMQAMQSRMELITNELFRTKDLLESYKKRAEAAEAANKTDQNGYASRPNSSRPAQSLEKDEERERKEQGVLPRPIDSGRGSSSDGRSMKSLVATGSSIFSRLRSGSQSVHRVAYSAGIAQPVSPRSGAVFGSQRSASASAADWLLQRAGIADGQTVTAEHIKSLRAGISAMMEEPRGIKGEVGSAVVLASMLEDERTAGSLPYASLVGVVLVGVGLMAWLNGWQKNR